MSKSPGIPSKEINLCIALIPTMLGTTKGTKTTKKNVREKNDNLYLYVLGVLCGFHLPWLLGSLEKFSSVQALSQDFIFNGCMSWFCQSRILFH